MNRPTATPATPASRADSLIRRTAGVTVAGLAGIAGALSYSHMRQLAEAHGNAGWHAHTLPLSVDGVEIVASLVLLADRRTGRHSGWLPLAALLIGTAATAQPGTISRINARWPALALLIAVKLLSGSSTVTPQSVPLQRRSARQPCLVRPQHVPGTTPPGARPQ